MLAVFLVVGIVALAQGKGRGFSVAPLYDGAVFSWSLVFGAVSIAVLSFLGFDGISMLAEENRGEAADRPGNGLRAPADGEICDRGRLGDRFLQRCRGWR